MPQHESSRDSSRRPNHGEIYSNCHPSTRRGSHQPSSRPLRRTHDTDRSRSRPQGRDSDRDSPRRRSRSRQARSPERLSLGALVLTAAVAGFAKFAGSKVQKWMSDEASSRSPTIQTRVLDDEAERQLMQRHHASGHTYQRTISPRGRYNSRHSNSDGLPLSPHRRMKSEGYSGRTSDASYTSPESYAFPPPSASPQVFQVPKTSEPSSIASEARSTGKSEATSSWPLRPLPIASLAQISRGQSTHETVHEPRYAQGLTSRSEGHPVVTEPGSVEGDVYRSRSPSIRERPQDGFKQPTARRPWLENPVSRK